MTYWALSEARTCGAIAICIAQTSPKPPSDPKRGGAGRGGFAGFGGRNEAPASWIEEGYYNNKNMMNQLGIKSLRSGKSGSNQTGPGFDEATAKEWRKAAEPWFTLLFLPPYCPDLNPFKRVWRLNRRAVTNNKYFPSIDDMIASVENAFDEQHYGNDALRHLCAIT